MNSSRRSALIGAASSIHKWVAIILLCMTASCVTTNVFAADIKEGAKSFGKKKPASKKKTGDKTDAKKSELKDGKEADTEGSKKKWEVLLNAGLEPSPFIGLGGTVGRYLKSDLALEAFFSRSSGKVEPVAITIMNAGVRVRKNFGKIPYVAGGLGMSMASGSWFTLAPAPAEDQYASSATSNAITLNLAAGAQMHFGSFVLGADAVGVVFPVVKMGVKDTPPTETYDEDDYKEQKAKFSKVAGGMGLVLLKVGIGFAF